MIRIGIRGKGAEGWKKNFLLRGWSSGTVEFSVRVSGSPLDGSLRESVEGGQLGSSHECLSFPGKYLRSPATQPAILAFAV